MAEQCVNCGAKITSGTLLSSPNHVLPPEQIRVVNFVEGSDYEGLCDKCGQQLFADALHKLSREFDEHKNYLDRSVPEFPMLTVGVLPGANEYLALGMVTANVAVGTGLFNEFSQGISDLFGAVNEQSGMALKVNKGEAAARSILVKKALGMGGNAIIGVDVDYGVTTNNAATVNMQGTAVAIANAASVFGEDVAKIVGRIDASWRRVKQLSRWSQGDIRDGEVYSA